jgi:divalent metal cation (Fe/Co/Zn/Cd) transporter
MADLVQGGKVAKRSFFVQLMVGLSEFFMGVFTLSIALIADGIQSFADAGVSLIVWIGCGYRGKNLTKDSNLATTVSKP